MDIKIEIFLFRSYLSSMYYNDIDIAVVVYDRPEQHHLNEKINEIEKKYSVSGLYVDITVITEDDIIENNCTQFLKNICEGKCYYKSPEVRRSITDYDITPGNYDVMIEYFKNHAENHKNDDRVFVSDVFYMYYHAFAALLSSQNISWYGEKSLIAECERLSMDENKILELEMSRANFIDLMRHVRLFCKEKNRAYLLSENSEDMDKLIRYFNMDVGRVQKIKRFCGEIQNLS